MPKKTMGIIQTTAGRKFSIGVEVARIEPLDVETWKEELAKIENETDRAAVRSVLMTIYELRRKENA